MKHHLIEPTLLFELSINLKSVKNATTALVKKTAKTKRVSKVSSGQESESNSKAPLNWELHDEHLLPHFGALSGYKTHSQVWCGWSEAGIFLKAKVDGKSNPPRFYGEGSGVSDGLRVWLDTRSSPGIHRATRFCHCFHFFPSQSTSTTIDSKDIGNDGENQNVRARGILDAIPRARDNPVSVDPKKLVVANTFHPNGYTLWSHIPASCLTGYSPEEFNEISLFYEVVDFELGTQSMSLGPELRYVEDPSLWIRASLVE